MELLHQPGDIITERYRILNTLGQGGVGITYEAEDLQSGQQVALKALSLRRIADWKMMELFEREARILSQLNHSAIPRYLDYFQVDAAQDRFFYIAQQLAPGKSLAMLVENGWHPSEIEVKHLATQILEILVYLHSFTPPVIHRDIKPQNIIRQENGQVFLVDFGAVQDTYHNTVTGGSTVVGTFGYMAPEQFRGQAVLSTDLYGLATTLLFLLSRKSPADLPQRKLKINFRSYVDVSNDFADWLEKMLEPAIENRFSSASEALAVLRGELALNRFTVRKVSQPKNSRIELSKAEERLVIKIPAVWLRSTLTRSITLVLLLWNAYFCLCIWLIYEFIPTSFNINFIIISPIVWVITIAFISKVSSNIKLEIDKDNFRLKWCVLGWCYPKIKGFTKDINHVKVSKINLLLNKKVLTFCVRREKFHKYRFGTFLTELEKEWLVWEITTFLDKVRS